ncbi:MAG: Ig-like domain-containing protein [Burkholderiales bacterium]|nr:Ig-like domain-containing protein [Burkholderiales bacterium]
MITSNGGGASAAILMPENATVLTTVTATDQDAGATQTYSLSGGADALKFAINASSGVLSFVTPPSFATPTDAGGDSIYDVTVQVSDGTNTDTQAIAVTVTAVNDNIPAFTSAATANVVENSTAVLTVTATDADPSATQAYSITGGADAAKFAIDASTGVLTFAVAPDFEVPTDSGTDNIYDVTVQVSDGIHTDTQAIAVTVTDVDEIPPTLSGSTPADNVTAVAVGSNIVLTFSENVAAGTGNIVISDGADTRTIAVGDAQVVISGNTVTINPTLDLNANTTYYVQIASGVITDVAGNAYAGIADTTTLNFDTTDTFAAAPSAPDLDAASDFGFSNTDDITNVTTPTLTGTGAEAGATVTLYDTGGATVLGTGVADGAGAWSITSSVLLADVHNLTAKQTDLSGNVSFASGGLDVTIDTTRPGNTGASFGTGSTIVLDFDEAVTANNSSMFLAQNPSSSDWSGTAVTYTVASSGTNQLTLTTNPTHVGTDYVRVRIDANNFSTVADVAGNTVSSREVYVGGGGNNTIDLSNYGSDFVQILRGNGGDDTLIGTSAADTLIDGGGIDTLTGGGGADTIRLVENGGLDMDPGPGTNLGPLYSRDTVIIGLGESTTNAMDVIRGNPNSPAGTGFDINSVDDAKHDVLSLQSNVIAGDVTNVTDNGATNAGVLLNHSISSGIVTFYNANTGGSAVTINTANLADALNYLSANITTPGTTVAFRVDTNGNGSALDSGVDALYVFQDSGTIPLSDGYVVPDTLVALAGLINVGSATLGTTAGANVVHVVDTTPPEPIGFALTADGFAINTAENAFATSDLAMSIQKFNGVSLSLDPAISNPTSVSGSGTTSLAAHYSGLSLAPEDWALMSFAGDTSTNSIRDAANNFLSGGDTWAEGGSGNNTIDLSGFPVGGAITGYGLSGNVGNDILTGSDGDDWIDGGTGADTMTGGLGSDDFDFQQGDSPAVTAMNLGGGIAGVLDNGDTFTFGGGVDRITDFANGEGFNLNAPHQDLSGQQGVGWMGGQFETPATSVKPANGLATDQGFYLVQGNFDGTTTFNVHNAGADTLVVWDGDSTGDVLQTGIVLSGVTLADLNAYTGNNWIQHI